MTETQFSEWTAKYRKRFLGPGENWDFLLEWQRQLESLEFNDAIEAIADVALDPREEARFPRQHLRLIVEHANARRDQYQRANRQNKRWGKKPMPPESWDRRMLERGAIDQAEFDRRRNERKERSQ